MTRLAIFWLLILATMLVAGIIAYVLLNKAADAAIVAALVGGLTAVVLNGAVAIIRRNGGTEDAAQ